MDKTLNVTIGEREVPVAELPKNIRDAVEFFDKLREDFTELQEDHQELAIEQQAIVYEQGKVNAALLATRQSITMATAQHLGISPDTGDGMISDDGKTEIEVEPESETDAEVLPDVVK